MKTQNSFSDQTFDSLDLSDFSLIGKEFEGCIFLKCNLTSSEFRKSRFIDCVFDHCDLSNAQIVGSTWRGTTFKDSKLVGINWAVASAIAHLGFKKCNLNYSIFTGVDLRKSEIRDCVAKEADFADANLAEADCQGTDFIAARFANTNLSKADFRRAINYSIRVGENKVNKAHFSLPEATLLLHGLDIILEE
ncbi:MAG TPA: pentapeptide repeat-containing protein [Bdellovibrionales bacterium]|nr:pentapeptide repeat-containing protein [Bdellovibrionales bacterium]